MKLGPRKSIMASTLLNRPNLVISSTFSQSLTGASLQQQQTTSITAVPVSKEIRAATSTIKVGTQRLSQGGTVATGKKITSIEVFSKEKVFRAKQNQTRKQPKILARVEQLRLLSKLEQAGLLSLLEKNGVTLSAIEKSGALSLAESLGLISAAADPSTPGALYTLATLLLAAGPTLVFFTPDEAGALIALQAVGAAVCVAGGSAAWGGASLLSSLQKST